MTDLERFVELVEKQVGEEQIILPPLIALAAAHLIKQMRERGKQVAKKRWVSVALDPSPTAARNRAKMRAYRARKAKQDREKSD